MKPLEDLERIRLHFLHRARYIFDHLDSLAPLFGIGQQRRQGGNGAVRLEFGDNRLLTDQRGAPFRAERCLRSALIVTPVIPLS